MMGVDVIVTSEPGKGSVFTVRLPGDTIPQSKPLSRRGRARAANGNVTATPEVCR